MRRILRNVCLTTACLVILAGGCRKTPPTPSPAQPSAKGSPAAPAQPPKAAEDPRAELRTAIQKFQTVKSFRTKVLLTTAQGKLNAILEFQKPNRFRGTIDIEKTGTAEIVAVDSSLYMRVNGQNWLNLSKTPSAQSIGDTLRGALSGDANLDILGSGDTTPVTKSRDSANNCDLYTTTAKTVDEKVSYPASVCVRDGLPKFLDLQTPQGPIHLEYYDYNELFLIVKPM